MAVAESAECGVSPSSGAAAGGQAAHGGAGKADDETMPGLPAGGEG